MVPEKVKKRIETSKDLNQYDVLFDAQLHYDYVNGANSYSSWIRIKPTLARLQTLELS